MTGDDPDAVGEVVDRFLADTPRQLAAMRAAVEADRAEDLPGPAAAVAGTAATIGALELAELCQRLAELARRDDLPAAAALLPSAEAAYADVVEALAAARASDWTMG
jgi:HPt (histidine-containing phosphotransfer) domain-containing protein